jgi:transcriptional regulator with XRE-family HTH domain
MIIGTQILVARILLGLTQKELAKLCKISLTTMGRTETDRTGSYGKAETMKLIQTILENKGATFKNSDGEIGVSVKEKYVSNRKLKSKKK